jgi:hypothetical protein
MENISRRHLLKGALASAGAITAAELARRALRESIDHAIGTSHPEKPKEMPSAEAVSFHDYQPNPRPYETGELAGRKFSDHLSDYTGIEGVVGKTAMIDFKGQLAQMMKDKLAYMQTGNQREADDPALVAATQEKLFSSYDVDTSTKTNLAGYERCIAEALKDVRGLDLKALLKLHSFEDFDDTQMALLKRFESSIDARSFLAFSVTEIMPTEGPQSKIGVEVYDFLLRNAGQEYIERIPAMHDKLLSYGPYQFTRNALEDSPDVKNGASQINRILPKSQIPAHVAQLRGGDHHKAAYLFALYNIAHLVKRLGDDDEKPHRAKKLLEHFEELPADTVLEYISTAHHLPGNAMDAFEDFTDAFIESKETYHGDHAEKAHKHDSSFVPSFSQYAAQHGVGEYCKKTTGNLNALRARLDQRHEKNI